VAKDDDLVRASPGQHVWGPCRNNELEVVTHDIPYLAPVRIELVHMSQEEPETTRVCRRWTGISKSADKF
jgi:hypothetical protein